MDIELIIMVCISVMAILILFTIWYSDRFEEID